MRTFRVIHVLSLLGYLGATLHGLYAGTDAPLLAMQIMYKGTLLVVIFLFAYWIIAGIQQKLSARNEDSRFELENESR